MGFVLLFGTACGDSDEDGQLAQVPSPEPPVGAEQREVSEIDLFSSRPGAGEVVHKSGGQALTVEQVLENGLLAAGASPAHIAFRGTASTASVRCDWRGVARTPAQREQAVRVWLGLDAADEIPEASYLEILFAAIFDTIDPQFRETAKSNFNAIALGGLSTEYLFVACYADYTVSEYLLGAGPTALTVAYDRRGEAHSYDLYRVEHDAGMFGAEALMSEGEYQQHLDETLREAEAVLSSDVGGRESVVFLAPMGAHNAIAVEAWQAVAQWELQTDSQGTVHAVRYGVLEGDPEHTQTLANLEMRITTAAAADDFADDRIASATGLTQHYRDIGAYDDITPDDGSTDTFTPSQPPAAYSCASGTAVTSPEANPGLVHDCEALLDGKDTLRGTGALNWATSTAMTSWDGVTTAGSPERVTKVELDDESLTGSIPVGLGTLFELTHLDLSDNSLTGDIPAELGWLHNLEEVRLSGNSLTGCIPLALRDVATNDLSSLSLPYCRPPAPGSPTAGTVGEASVPLTWTAVANTAKYRVDYREGDSGYWTVADDAITGMSHTVDGLQCEQEYQFRVSAYGSGTGFAAAWGDPSASLTATTGTCTPPVFDPTSYSFSVLEDAALETVVGSVSATDNSGEPVTYAITDGNTDDRFAIDEDTGTITVAADLSGTAGTTVTLTVAARDAAGGEATATVTVQVRETCASGTAVSNPTANPGLVADCNTLLGLQSALAGTAVLNWSVDTSIASWEGVRISGTPRRVTELDLDRKELTGVIPPELRDLAGLEILDLYLNALTGEIPPELGDLSQLEDLHLGDNNLTGGIPAELGGLTELTDLWLADNGLTGAIPSELGDLSSLVYLWLADNELTGSIPPELGKLTALRWLWLADNDLSGTIPAELTGLTNLTLLLLYGNNLVGCVPRSLQDVDFHDLDDLGLDDCQEGPAAPTGLSASLTGGDFTVTWTALSGVDEYEVQWRIDGSGNAWEALPTVQSASATYTPMGGAQCSSTYEFRVRAHGDGFTYATHWGPESTVVTVDTPSCPPEFDQASYAFDVAEDASVDDAVGTVSATDPDGDDVSYSITAGNTGSVFAIDDETGAIKVAAALDHETTDEYTLTVEAEDDSGQADTVTVTITVTDVAEDAAPAPGNLGVTLSFGTFTLTWDSVTGATKYEAQHTTDAADAATVTWTALAETTGTTQNYTPAGGVACGTEYRFRVRAYGDGTLYVAGWGAESGVESVATESCPPEFDEASYAFDVAEDAAVDHVVGTVSAMDPDDGDTVSYSISAGNTGSVFAIDDETGAIKVAAALDHETTDEYTLTVEAEDDSGQADTVTVTITVTDEEEIPEFGETSYAFDVAEDAAVDYVVGTVSATDPDGDDVSYSISAGNTGSVFATGDETGAITVAAALDHETTDEYTLTVEAEDDSGQTDTVTVTITVTDEDEAPEFDEASYAFDVAEDAAVDHVVGTVSAMDPDDGDTVSYSISAGNTGSVFAIGDETGAITVAGTLDHETTDEYTLMVEAEDDSGQTDTVTATITVTDVTEDAPPAPSGLSVSLADGVFSLSWTAVAGAAKYEAQHTTDAADASTVTWTALPEVTTATAAYTPTDGPECSTAYRFRVRAYGDGETYAEVWGTESDVESVETATCPPAFAHASYDFFILDTAVADSTVGRVSATDPDADDTVTYTITGGNDAGKFAINEMTGRLAVAGTEAFNLAQTPYYVLTVEASDGRGGTGTARVRVALTRAECANVRVVPQPSQNQLLVRDCSILLTARDTLRGTATLNWSANTSIFDWEGVGRRGTDSQYVGTLYLPDLGLDGTIPEVLAGLAELRRLDLDGNDLTGSIPASLGSLEELERLYLFGNRLAGSIPVEFGNLKSLQVLSLYDNDLTGSIPTELGKLSRLRELLLDGNALTGSLPVELGDLARLENLYVRDNQLTGSIPTELTGLDNLTYLFLEGNSFIGCIPAGLRDVANHDLNDLGLADCTP